MAWKIFNIGKANAEIERLTAELATANAKVTTPSADASQLADALASNEQISTQLTQANSDLATAKASITSLTTNLEKAQGEVTAVNAALKAACTAINLDISSTLGQTNSAMITALQAGVSSTLAKLNVDPAKVPVAKPTTDVTSLQSPELKGRARFSASVKIQK